VQPPASYLIQFWNGSDWVDIPNQTKSPAIPAAFVNTVNFDVVTSNKVKIEFINKGGGVCVTDDCTV